MAFLGNYTNLRVLGRGAFATVYKVRHNNLGYVRAIKVLHELITSEDDPSWQTFIRECKLLLKIGSGAHPNIVRIYQPMLIDSKASVEMDYVDGISLMECLKENPFMEYTEVDRFINEVVGAMAYCHHDIYRFLMDPLEDLLVPDPNDARRYIISPEKERELVAKYAVCHNDLHSNNIIRRSYDGTFVLLDFGLAIQNGVSVKSSSRNDGASEYRPPEKWENSRLTPASDVYALGVLLFEVLTGRVPFPIDTMMTSLEEAIVTVRNQHLHSAPPAIEPLRKAAFEKSNPGKKYVRDYPVWLDKIVEKALAKNPADRYATAREMLDDINSHRKADGTTVISAELTEAREQLDKTRLQLAEATTASSEAHRQLDEARQQLAEATTASAETVKSKEAEIERLKQQNRQLTEAGENASAARTELAGMTQSLEAAKAEIDDLGKRLDAAKSENSAFANKIKELNDANAALASAANNQTAAKEIERLNAQLAETGRKLSETDSRLTETAEQLKKAADEKKLLEKELKSARKSAASVSGGAVLGGDGTNVMPPRRKGSRVWMTAALSLLVLFLGAAAWGVIQTGKVNTLNDDVRSAVSEAARYRREPPVADSNAPEQPRTVTIHDTVTTVLRDTVTVTQTTVNPADAGLRTQINNLNSTVNQLREQNRRLQNENASLKQRINNL